MVAACAFLILALGGAGAAGGIPPLEDAARAALGEAASSGHPNAATFEGRGFAILLEHIRSSWTGEIGDAAIRIKPDFDAIVADPAGYCGDLVLIRGRIEQIEALRPPPAEMRGVEAWFIRPANGRPVLVYVDFAGAARDKLPRQVFEAGERIEIAARFLGVMSEEARDGEVRAYPVFVGAFPRQAGADAGIANAQAASAGAAGDGGTRLTLMAGLILGLGVLFLVLFIIARRLRDASQRPPHLSAEFAAGADDAGSDERIDLPRDPIEALAVLQRHAEEEGRGV